MGSEYAWAFIAGFHLLVWLILFFTNKNLRWPMAFMSLLLATIGPIGEFLTIPDYWNPGYLASFTIKTPVKAWTFGLEDWVGTFSSTGICTGLFELLYSKINSRRKFSFNFGRYFISSAWALALLFLMLMFYARLGMTGIQSMLLALLIISILIYSFRFSYLKTGIIAALIMAFCYWFFLSFIFLGFFPHGIHEIWNNKGNAGLYLFGVPVEEIIFAFLYCLIVGPFYRLTFTSNTKYSAANRQFSTIAIEENNEVGLQ